MSGIEAVYRDGVFKPLADVELGLHENQRVRLHVEPIEAGTSRAWLEDVRQLHRAILDRRGPLPDSAPSIAADRSRDT
jgi:predicted DNA-binding antitoxin AbrB/MazE fold protein